MTDRKILRRMRREEEMADILMGIAEGIARGAMAVAILLIAILFIAHSQPEEVQAATVTAIPEAQELPEMVPLGDFRITFYCACRKCSGKWGHRTESGATCVEGVTAATDYFRPGTRIYIEGFGERIVQDTGVHGRWIDIFMEDHDECNENGIQYRQIYVIRE